VTLCRPACTDPMLAAADAGHGPFRSTSWRLRSEIGPTPPPSGTCWCRCPWARPARGAVIFESTVPYDGRCLPMSANLSTLLIEGHGQDPCTMGGGFFGGLAGTCLPCAVGCFWRPAKRRALSATVGQKNPRPRSHATRSVPFIYCGRDHPLHADGSNGTSTSARQPYRAADFATVPSRASVRTRSARSISGLIRGGAGQLGATPLRSLSRCCCQRRCRYHTGPALAICQPDRLSRWSVRGRRRPCDPGAFAMAINGLCGCYGRPL